MKSKPSLKSKMIYRSLKAIRFSERAFARLLKNPPRKRPAFHSPKKGMTVHRQFVQDFELMTLSNAQSGNKHILFFHGGAYVAEAIKAHRQLAERLVTEFGFKVTLIDYPLAPEYQADFTIKQVETAYVEMLNFYNRDDFYLFGDSAGGGLALVLLQQLRDKQIAPMPIKTALLSPWVDASMSNPEIDKYAVKDVIITKKGLADCGKIYAGNLSINNPLVSPINAEMNDLGDVHIWLSDMELLYPDGVKLFEKMSNATGTTAHLSIQPEMMHDWIVLPIPEAKETLDEIASALK